MAFHVPGLLLEAEWLGLGALVVVNELTPGAGRGRECSFWLLPCAG